MKRLLLLTISILIVFGSYSCGIDIYTQHEHKHFLIPNLFTSNQYRQSLIATTNNLHYNIKYNIYNKEKDNLISKLQILGISKSTIELMHTKIVESVSIEGNHLSLLFKDEYDHKKIKIHDIRVDNFYPKKVIKEFAQLKQLDLLKFLMYRHIVLFDSKNYVFEEYAGRDNYNKEVAEKIRTHILTEIDDCPAHLIDDYAMLLIDMNLFAYNHLRIITDYMMFLKNNKEFNVVAHSHFAGATTKLYAVEPSFEYMEYRDNNELSVYLFSKLFEYPELYRKALAEISFVIDNKKDFDWDKCFSYCKTQEEKDRINLAKLSIFSGVNISLFDYFKTNTTNNSKLFELALIQYIQRIEYNLFSPLYVYGHFEELYKKNSSNVNKYDLADAIDLKNYINNVDIQNKVLLHMLRGYLSFMLGEFKIARKEYNLSLEYIQSANYLTSAQKLGYKKQLNGLMLLEQLNNSYTKSKYKSLNKQLISFLQINYKTEEMDSYFELGLTHAIKAQDFITAFFYSNNNGFHQEAMLDVFMNNDELKGLLKIVKQNSLPFEDRYLKKLEYAIIEQLGTNHFRNGNLEKTKYYFDKLPNHIFNEGKGGNFYYQYRWHPWDENYYDFSVDYSKDMSVKQMKKFNKKTALYKVIELETAIEHNKNRIKSSALDSASISLLRRELSNLYFELSCIYSSPFWGYSRVWASSLTLGIYYINCAPFHDLDPEFIRSKLDSFLYKYGNQHNSIKYLKKAIYYEDNENMLAQLNFKLYDKLKDPFQTSFHRRKYKMRRYWWHKDELWNIKYIETLNQKKYEKDKVTTGLIIDSLYRHTDYFNEVIAECSDFKRKNNKQTQNKVEKEIVVKKVKDNSFKYLSILLILIIVGLLLNIFKKTN